MPLASFGVQASAWRRLALGGAFCAIAVGLVWLVERPAPAAAPVAAAMPAAARRLHLAVESTYAVAAWRVSVLRSVQTATASDAWNWQGEVDVPPGEQVLVVGVAAPEAAAPHRGLRLRLGDGPERIVWGAGDVAAAVEAP